MNSGVLAQIRSPGRTADEVAGCVAKAVQRFCTRRAPQKHTYKPKEPPRLVEAAARRILQRVEMFSADGAANEQLAGRLLHPAVERTGTADKLPNLKMILRDKAHAARRLTQRTFKVDPLLDDLQRIILFGVEDASGGSVAKMLRDSGPCADIFKKEVERQEQREGVAGVVTHLGYAKQRFDNTAKPLAVAVWNLDAVISSCDLIARDSAIRGQFRRVAETFLTMLSPETILLLGMLADASDEVLVLVRFFDKEAFEVDRMAEAVETFKRQLSALFRGRVCLRTGFTQLCLKHLQTTKLVRLGNGALRTVCGPAVDVNAVVQKCLQRMVAWARLVEEVVSTEFPAWELLGAFSVFRLADAPTRERAPARPAALALGDCAQQRLLALADAFNVDGRQLVEEFQDHQRVAQGIKNTRPEVSSVEAWREALAKTQRTPRSQELWPARALLPVADRYFVCPGSTAGIEQTFSMFKRMTGEQWHASELAEERHLVLTLRARREKALPAAALVSARHVWVANFGPSRVQEPSLGVRARRLLQNRDRRRHVLRTGAGWLAQRRRKVAAEAERAPSETAGAIGGAAAAWTEKHEAEARHQRLERQERACAATEERTAAEGAASAEARAAFRTAERGRAAGLAVQARRKQRVHAIPAAKPIHGACVFVAGTARRELDHPPGAWARLRRSHSLREVHERQEASFLVVADPAAPGDRNRVVAALLGRALCSPRHLATGAGPVLQLQRALRLPRFLFVSARCEAKHGAMLDLMRSTCGRAGTTSRWRWVGRSEDEEQGVLARAAKRGKAGRGSEMVTLIVSGEEAAHAHFPNVMLITRLINKIWCVDHGKSLQGTCGR